MDTKNQNTTFLTGKEIKDLRILGLFTEAYCRGRRHAERAALGQGSETVERCRLSSLRVCPGCRAFLLYAMERRLRCPLDEKPSCKHCRIHCYRPGHREKVREIMRYSGKRLILRGRLDLLWHYLF